MYRFKGIFNLKERERIYDIFIFFNLIIVSLFGPFVEKYLQRKLKKIQERALRFMLKDQISIYKNHWRSVIMQLYILDAYE